MIKQIAISCILASTLFGSTYLAPLKARLIDIQKLSINGLSNGEDFLSKVAKKGQRYKLGENDCSTLVRNYLIERYKGITEIENPLSRILYPSRFEQEKGYAAIWASYSQLQALAECLDRAIHQQAVELFARYTNEYVLDFEIKHREIIERFGRYPHRNAVLGRQSTAEELAFLQEPGSSF